MENKCENCGKFVSKKIHWTTRLVKKMGVIYTIIVLMVLGALIASEHEYTYASAITKVQMVKEIPPVLKRIAKCESPTGQFKNGQVTINGTQDIGKYQINVPTWAKKATELGYNLATEEGNEKMAVWIYENKGTGPWSSSAGCWNK